MRQVEKTNEMREREREWGRNTRSYGMPTRRMDEHEVENREKERDYNIVHHRNG